MTTNNKALAGLLVVQVLLAGLTWWPTGSDDTEVRDLLGFPVDTIDTITIEGRLTKDEVPEPALVLKKAPTGWVIASSEGYPATDANVDPLLESLGKLHVRNPIAIKEESQASLEVAEANHTRKVTVDAGDQHRVLYFGAGQGQSAHVRLEGEVETFDVKGVSAWSINTNANRFFDRDGFIKVPVDTVSMVAVERPDASFAIEKAADGMWVLQGRPEEPLDQAATRSFVQNLLTVRMLEPGGRDRTPAMGFDRAVVVRWTADEGGGPANHEYLVGAEIEGENGRRWVASDGQEWVVKALNSNLSSALTDTVDKLLDKPIDLSP
ncbi:MAG: DUF4340 domain-containing protein [Myxococcales bacterium]|nr:DUF4340 domain-containing protein [Myxococcales bacterium]